MSSPSDEGDDPPIEENSNVGPSLEREEEETIITETGENDVLCGRGRAIMNSNKSFLELVSQNEEIFRLSNTEQRERIVHNIVAEIVKSGGRFLQKSGNGWTKMKLKEAKVKTRTALHNKKKSQGETMSVGTVEDTVPSVGRVAVPHVTPRSGLAIDRLDDAGQILKTPPGDGDEETQLERMILQFFETEDPEQHSAKGTVASATTYPTNEPSMVTASDVSRRLAFPPLTTRAGASSSEPNQLSTESSASFTSFPTVDPSMATISGLSLPLGTPIAERSIASLKTLDPLGRSPSTAPALDDGNLYQVVHRYKMKIAQLRVTGALGPALEAMAKKFDRDLVTFEKFSEDPDVHRDKFCRMAMHDSWKRLMEALSP